jgi:hypothetical protein
LPKDPRKRPDFAASAPTWPAADLRTTEAFRRAAEAAARRVNVARPPQKGWLFWRVFVGTLLTLAALTVLADHHQLSTSFSELRGSIDRLHEAQGNLPPKEEFDAGPKAAGNAIDPVKEEAPAQKTRLAPLDALLQALQQGRKELSDQVRPPDVKAAESRPGAAPKAEKKDRSAKDAGDRPID